ncbi:MAG: IclR family transcriptional regulator [Puniceicoccaceae bacterium]|nr:MAG: IclR family transcriptional regulator [Puniceicoccaceae bacterium]
MSRKRPAESDHFNVGMQLLRFLVRSPRSLGVSEIAEKMGIAVSSAHDMLRVLGELGFVAKDESSRCYRASPQFFELVHDFANEFGATRKLRNALDELSQKYDASIYLGTLWGHQSIIIAAAGSLGATHALGASGPAYTTAIGRAIISQMNEDEWSDYAPENGETLSPDTSIQDADDFRKALLDIREKGVAWNIGKTGATVSVAAPIIQLDQSCTYGVAFIFAEADWIPHRRTHYAQTIRKCAEILSDRLVLH